MNLFKKAGIIDRFQLMVTLYDTKAQQHSMPTLVDNLNVAWRWIDYQMKDIAVHSSEYLLAVHGEMNKFKLYKAYQPYLETVYFKTDSRELLARTEVENIDAAAAESGALK